MGEGSGRPAGAEVRTDGLAVWLEGWSLVRWPRALSAKPLAALVSSTERQGRWHGERSTVRVSGRF